MHVSGVHVHDVAACVELSVQDRVEVNGTVHHALAVTGAFSWGHTVVRAAAAKSPIASTAVVVCAHALASAGFTSPTGSRMLSWVKVASVIDGTRLARLWPRPAAEQPAVEGPRKRKLQPECVERGAAEAALSARATKAQRTCSHISRVDHAASDGQPVACVDGRVAAPRSARGCDVEPCTPDPLREDCRDAGRADEVGTDAWLCACRVIIGAVAVAGGRHEAAGAWCPGRLPAHSAPPCGGVAGGGTGTGLWAAAVADAERTQCDTSHAAALLRIAAALSAIDVRLQTAGVPAGAEGGAGLAAGAGAGGPLRPCVTAARLAQCVASDLLKSGAGDGATRLNDRPAAPLPDRGDGGACSALVQPACMVTAQLAVLFAPAATNALARCALAAVHILGLTRRAAGVGLPITSEAFPGWAWCACDAALSDALPTVASVRPLVQEPDSLWRSAAALTVLLQLLRHCAVAAQEVTAAGYDALTAVELAVEAAADGGVAAAGDGGASCRTVLAVSCMAAARVTLALASCKAELAPEAAAAPEPPACSHQVRTLARAHSQPDAVPPCI